MSEEQKSGQALSGEELEDLVASSDTGARNVAGPIGKALAGVALVWSLFQLWIASPLPFLVGDIIPVLNSTHTRSIHLAFAIFLAYMAFPALKGSPRDRIPVQDWVTALLGAFCAAYLFLFYNQLAERPGQPTTFDLVTAGLGLVLLLEATRRSLGPPLMIVAIFFLAYVFFGSYGFIPEVIQWKGATFNRAMDQMWLTTEGVFGIALGVSTSFVFLFVLFGALLEKGGAGNYFIQLAFGLLGHMRGGPAKAAVLASAMTGLISGSSIANVVTTGVFTMPLMKRVGFSPEKAGSVEVASSVNGQIMPPVMGAAAFLMVEYVGIAYVDVIKHAFLPAAISYIALLYIVHLEAMKANMQGLPKPVISPLKQTLIRTGIIVCSIVILSFLIYYGLLGLKAVIPGLTGPIAALVLLLVYVILVGFAARSPDLEMEDPNAEIVKLPIAGQVVKTGLHYLLPIVVLVWFLMVEQKSPGLSAFWACALLILILVTQRPLKGFFRGRGAEMAADLRLGWQELIDGLITGARNMIGIAVATATAGVIVGTVTLTGVGQKMAELVEWMSGGSLILGLMFTALISLILGMGLPTTANYIVVSSLMAPVVVELGAANGLIVPLIAVHLFVFYFGIMADVTPPVGLASFAAAAVSGGDPIKTGFTAFFYSLRTVALPFLFIFNTDLLLIDVTWFQGIFIFVIATAAMLIFAASTQGFFFARSRIWESVLLLLIAFSLFRPGFWLDMVQSPFRQVAPSEIVAMAGQAPVDGQVRLVATGENIDGDVVTTTVQLPLGPAGDGALRLAEQAGIEIREEDGKVLIDNIGFGSPAEEAGLDFDWEITSVEVPAERLPKEIFYIPALLLLGLIVLMQRRRRPADLAAAPAPAE
ncbi:MAG: TRAP transporter permease [Kiloniellales bacterium]|nr:TRAP transporter permease [Kiloniellales bacterium]